MQTEFALLLQTGGPVKHHIDRCVSPAFGHGIDEETLPISGNHILISRPILALTDTGLKERDGYAVGESRCVGVHFNGRDLAVAGKKDSPTRVDLITPFSLWEKGRGRGA